VVVGSSTAGIGAVVRGSERWFAITLQLLAYVYSKRSQHSEAIHWDEIRSRFGLDT